MTRPSELPPASARELLVARAIATVASVFFALVAFWEIAGPFGAGHYAASCAVTLGGENMLRLRTLLPVINYPLHPPTTADCYCHHPFGVFWTAAAFVAVFGHHDFVCRLPAALLSSATPPLLYALGRCLWSPLAGATAALAFVCTPIALSFANFNALEVPVIFGTLLASFGYVRFSQTRQRKFLVTTLFALVYSVNTDWPAFVFAAGLLGLVFVRTFVGPFSSPPRYVANARLFAWGIVLVGAVGLAYLALLVHIDQLDALIAQGRARAAGAERPLSETLAERRYWIALMFTPLAVAIGKLAVPVIVARVVAKRSELEALPLVALAMASFQYVVFAEGADVHIFWPHYFAPYFALALGAIAQTLREGWRRGAARLANSRPRIAVGWTLAVLPLLVPAVMLRDAVRVLIYARKTGGRFNERGHFIQPDKDKVAALSFLAQRAPEHAVVGLAQTMRPSLWVPWVLGLPTKVEGLDPSSRSDRYYVIDGRFASDLALRDNAKMNATLALGPFFVFDRAVPATSAMGYAIVRREPTLLERYFVSGTHALRDVRPDPFWAWEVRDHLLQRPNPEPRIEPQTLEQMRIAYNMAVHRGDLAAQSRYRDAVLAGTDRSAATVYEDGTKLLAVRFERGASDVLTVYFESPGAADQRFVIHSRVEARATASLIPKDELEWDVGLPTTLPRAVWKPGYLYSSVTEIAKRPGRERFFGYWVNTGRELPLKALDRRPNVTLLVLP